CRFHFGGVEPRKKGDDQHRSEHYRRSDKLVGDRAQNRVKWQIIPFRHDMDRRVQGIGLDVIVRIVEIVRYVKNDPSVKHEEADEGKGILHCEVGVEGQSVLGGFLLYPGWIVRAMHVQSPDVQNDDACNDEGKQVMQGEETVQGRIVDRIAAP